MKKFPGMTREECASACNEQGCVLSAGKPFCFHPCKGGLPKAFKDDPDLQALQADARSALGIKLSPTQGVTT